MPDDVVPISLQTWTELAGKQIEAGADGQPKVVSAAPPTSQQIAARLLLAVDDRLNTAAKTKGYDSIVTAALRAGYPGPFHDEGVMFATWMDATYATCYALLAEVQAGRRNVPTEAELMAELPVFPGA